jgi:RND family efflux transporter MFP subunit
LAEATAALERGEALRKSETLNQAEYDQRVAAQKSAAARRAAAEAGAKVADAELAAARAQRLSLQHRLARTDIVAPERGVVIERNARLGAIASAVGDPMFRVLADGEVELEAEVIETMLPRIQAGDPAEVRVAGLGDVAGTVRLVSPEVDPQTRLGTVRVSLARDANLRVGGFARGRILTDRRVAVTVPATAVLSDEDGAFVQVVVDGIIETRPVTTGILADDDWEITDGLREGEVVLARAGAFFQNGDRVTPVAQVREASQ